MHPYDDPRLAELAAAQAQVVSRQQLADLGVRYWHIRHRIRSRRWRLVGKRCVVLHRGPLGSDERRWIAVLELGQHAALCAETALGMAGMTGFASEKVHVLVTRGSRIRHFPWLKVHESRRYDPRRDMHPGAGPRRVRIERAVIDAAVWSHSPRRACAIVCAAVQQRLTLAPRLADELDRAGRVRYHRLLRATLVDVGGGSHALSELDLLTVCREAGLPRPRRQAVRSDRAGRRRYLDVEVRLPDGTLLVVEADGAGHMETWTWWDDQMRQNDVVVDGAVVLRFPAVALRLDRPRVVAQLRAIGRRHGLRERAGQVVRQYRRDDVDSA
jgi:hypothetical protein